MHRLSDRPFLRLALIGAFGLTLALAACGRKGELDLPPASTSATGQQKTAKTDLIRSPIGQTGKAQNGSTGAQVPHKRFFLDFLLN